MHLKVERAIPLSYKLQDLEPGSFGIDIDNDLWIRSADGCVCICKSGIILQLQNSELEAFSRVSLLPSGTKIEITV